MSVEQVINKFFGDLNRWPLESDGHNFTQAQIKSICERIANTGECLWHAQYAVMDWKICHCAKCMK